MKKSTKKHPGKKTRQRHIDFIRANWQALTHAAFQGFKKHGRGAIIISEEDFMTKPPGVPTKYSLGYLFEGSDAFKLAGNKWPGEKEASWVQTYDPEKTMLVMISRIDGGVSSYRLDGIGASVPSMAQQRTKAGMN